MSLRADPPACSKRALPRVSLVTPTFNQARYIEASVRSVLAQTYDAIEYIVIDDGSTDDTVEILRSFGDQIRWLSQPNAGQARTLNRGWAMATGDIIGYLSSDDLLKRDAVATAVKALAERPEAVACYCDFDLIDEFGRRVRSVQTQDFSRALLARDLVCLPGPGAFFRRSALVRTGGWNADLTQVPDFDFWLRLSRLGDFARVPINLADYRIHSESASYRRTSAAQSDEIIRVVAAYWSDAEVAVAQDATASNAMAHLISARSHFSSGRAALGVGRMLQAWRLAPLRALQPLPWRILAGGLLRRMYYGLRAAHHG
jgi:glycosyltransferase involved in cell wall biosynthesis